MNKKKKNNKNLLKLILIILLLMSFTFYYIYISGGNLSKHIKEEAVNYSTFRTDLESNKIKEINVLQTPTNKLVITYTLKDNSLNKKYTTEALNNNGLTNALDEKASKNEIIYNFSQAKDNTILASLIQTLLFLFLPMFFIFMMFSKAAKSQFGGAINQIKSKARLYKNNNIKFKDVAGYDEIKEELSEVVDFLKNSKKYISMGARIPKGILLEGYPGTGKTLLARATAGEAQVNFYLISGSEFLELYVGVGASRVRDMFLQAKKNAPSIIFIDEIDAIGRQRGAGLGGGNDEREQTLNQILVEMDGFERTSNVVVMAATNRSDVLDPALLRPGRFDRRIMVDLPDLNTRVKILELVSKNKPIQKDIDFKSLAQKTPNFSGAQLESVLNESALLSVRKNKEYIDLEEIEESIDRVLMGPQKKSRKYNSYEKKLVAFHEAGHAVIGLILENASIVQKITIIPRGKAGGYNLMTPKEEKFLITKKEMEDKIAGLLGGRVAEELMFNDITSGASNDIEQATNLAKDMVTKYGMSKLGPIQFYEGDQSIFLGRDYNAKNQLLSDYTSKDIDLSIKEIILNQHNRTKEIIENNKDLLISIAEALMLKNTITKEEIDVIYSSYKSNKERQ